MRDHCVRARMAKIRKSINIQCEKDSPTAGWMVQTPGKTAWMLLIKINIKLLYAPAIRPKSKKEMRVRQDLFTAAQY